jgi:hypothetical protein
MTDRDQEYLGITQVGEVPVVVRRHAETDLPLDEAVRTAQVQVYEKLGEFIRLLQSQLGPYDDSRPYEQIAVFLADRIREVRSGNPQ